MSFLKKIFGGKDTPPGQEVELSDDSAAFDGEPIKAFDKLGRELLISRRDWFENVLKGNIQKAWDNPDELADLVTGAFHDGFLAAMAGPCGRLREIDTNPERGYTYQAVYFLETAQPAKAQSVLEEYVRKHGESGVVLTNLAKAQSALGRDEESIRTLWRALETEPNQDNGLGWYEVIHREKDGEAAGIAALGRVAAIPGSWRAQLWLARHALKERRLDDALAIYDQALAAAGNPAPTDLLVQMSGDLGNAGHLMEILERAMPRFDPQLHGIQVGNNLIKTYIDTGQLDGARALIQRLQLLQRPDWQETLGYWEKEISKAACATENVAGKKDLNVSLLWLDGPMTMKAGSPTGELFPRKTEDAPRICFIGSTAEPAAMGNGILQQPSDNPGRFSRGMPLLLAEHTFLSTSARTSTLVPWVGGGQASFVLSGVMWKDDAAAAHARNGATPNDYVVISHLKARGENWTLVLRMVRTIDAKCLTEFEYAFAEFAPHTITDQLFSDLDKFLSDEAGAGPERTCGLALPDGSEINHYLFRLEQSLATRCYAMDPGSSHGLSNPAEIINGIIQTCAQNPSNATCRLLLLRTLAGLKRIDPELTASFREKIDALMEEHPIESAFQKAIIEELSTILVA